MPVAHLLLYCDAIHHVQYATCGLRYAIRDMLMLLELVQLQTRQACSDKYAMMQCTHKVRALAFASRARLWSDACLVCASGLQTSRSCCLH